MSSRSYAATSPCGRGCLPRTRTLPRVSLARQVGRLMALLGALVAGIGVALLMPIARRTGRARLMRGWFRTVVRATGVRLVVPGSSLSAAPAGSRSAGAPSAGSLSAGSRTAGAPSAGSRSAGSSSAGAPDTGFLDAGRPVLVAANHQSWLDIPALMAIQPMRMLAKSEVRGWPVIGFLAARGGTLFIDRERIMRLPRTIADLSAALRNGDTVAVFPEGSTWCGLTGGRYRPATMQAAIDAGVPVRPVTIRYQLADGRPCRIAAWVGQDSLVTSVWRILGTRGLVCRVEVGPLVPTAGRHRREVVAQTYRLAAPVPAPELPHVTQVTRRRRPSTRAPRPTRARRGRGAPAQMTARLQIT